MMYYDPRYFLMMIPAFLLALLAQFLVKAAYSQASQIVASMSGFAAARRILDSAGLQNVSIEEVPGHLTDHYDSGDKVLRLSSDVYHGRSMAAVGIAAHEAGHALQDAWHYAPLVVRNLAVPAANFGSGLGLMVMFIGFLMHAASLVLLGILMFSAMVFFQLVNLPVEFNASSRAKAQLMTLGIVDPSEMRYVNRVLNAAALTYVAATLQAVLQLLYYFLRYSASSNRE